MCAMTSQRRVRMSSRTPAPCWGVAPPPLTPLDEADLTPMARSFYADNRRVSNARIKTELGVALRFPDYRAGLAGLLAEEADAS